jgi:putative inorganic carbon (hco3(-)) transporter
VRDILLILATLGFLPLCLRYPAAGAICWAWFSLMAPHRLVYGFAYGQQFNLLIAAATLAGWLLSAERKRWTPDLVPKILLLFVLWTTLNTWFAPFQDASWFFWEQMVRSWALVFLIFSVAHTKVRVHAFVWVIVISLGFYGIKGGLFTIMTGGHFAVFGPPGSIIADNNQLALAIVMTLPLVNYLRMHTKMWAIRLGLGAAIVLEVVMALGSQSRGAAVALAAVFGIFWLTTRRKMLYAMAGILVIIAALSLMPAGYFDRLNTISTAESDNSFMGRVTAWYVAVKVAKDWFPFGAGFYAPQLPAIFHQYYPVDLARAAHSIYFQVLGEQGFIGLGIYLVLLALALRNAGIIVRQTRGSADLLWAYDLAKMMRVALIGYCVGGAALSMAYFDGLMILIALLSSLREITAPKLATEPLRYPIVGAPGETAGIAATAR